MASTSLSLIFLTLIPILFILNIPQTQAQTSTAPAPAPEGPLNLTGILDKNGQYATLIRLLIETQVADQINNQLNSSSEGFTIFAPTDNAFNSLPSGTINNLGTQGKVQLILYHVVPKYHSLADLLTVSNPVRTQATGQDGGVFGLHFTGQGNQVNVSTGVVETQINNAIRQKFPLALFQVDKVLLPEELFGVKAKAPVSAPAPGKTAAKSGSNNTKKAAATPSSPSDEKSGVAWKKYGLGSYCWTWFDLHGNSFLSYKPKLGVFFLLFFLKFDNWVKMHLWV
ncbi:Fasciclin-like arabinogalactan protein [Quillaja saponaria]|uniref:Fasciclin-like arabinogalactan protein n=1 Tax=Quillaja saponaria TaxID=32244 RepID=A0AAD7KYZ6_QUISA|nr:Fasciclin-like arabinogalactan protein [Quillaja saponaria]